MSHFILPQEYDGDREEQVIYADMPASKNRLKARFRDIEVNVADLKILNAFEGIYQGDPIYISYRVMENTVISASNTQNMTVKVIYPQWKAFESMPLAPYKYEMMIKHYEPIDDGDDCDWYYLKLIWFDDAPAADQSLEQYINSITSQLDFFDITKKLTYSEKGLLVLKGEGIACFFKKNEKNRQKSCIIVKLFVTLQPILKRYSYLM